MEPQVHLNPSLEMNRLQPQNGRQASMAWGTPPQRNIDFLPGKVSLHFYTPQKCKLHIKRSPRCKGAVILNYYNSF